MLPLISLLDHLQGLDELLKQCPFVAQVVITFGSLMRLGSYFSRWVAVVRATFRLISNLSFNVFYDS